MGEKSSVALGGRKVQAARNDECIWASAQAVFAADPAAPISAVTQHAGVGSSALYRRYTSKEELLRELALDGLRRYIVIAEAALADEGDRWESFASFLSGVVEADTYAMTDGLMGRFSVTEEVREAALKARELTTALFERTKAAGVIRTDLGVDDLSCILQQMASLRPRGGARGAEMRQRYLALHMDAMRTFKPS